MSLGAVQAVLQAAKNILSGFNAYNAAKTDYKASVIRAEAENKIREANNMAKREYGVYRRFVQIAQNEQRNRDYTRTMSAVMVNWRNRQTAFQSQKDVLGLQDARQRGEIAALQGLSGLRGSVFDKVNNAVSAGVANERAALERAQYVGEAQVALDVTNLNSQFVTNQTLDYQDDDLDFTRSFAKVKPSATQYILQTVLSAGADTDWESLTNLPKGG